MTGSANTIDTGLYLYGITRAKGAPAIRTSGVTGGSVGLLVEGELAAIVTPLIAEKIRPQRTNLAAHNDIVRELAEHRAVLPAAFGTVVESEEELHNVLDRNCDELLDRLRLLEGKDEILLKVYWETSNVFEYFVANHKELKRLRDQLFKPGKVPSVSEKIELGRAFDAVLQESRDRHTERVTRALSRYCTDIRSIDVGGEKMIMKLACLVARDRSEEFEEAIKQVASQFDNHYTFEYGNPTAPYDFVDVNLQLK